MSKMLGGRCSLAASLVPLLTLVSFAQSPSANIARDGSQSRITGTWRGNSECTVKNSPCHDEINVYRFSEIKEKPGWITGVGSKIVDSKEVFMGTLEWSYDAETRTLKSEFPNGTFRLVVDGNKIEGYLTLLDKTFYRRIHLKKEN